MKARCPLFPLLLILATLPALIILAGGRTTSAVAGEAAQSKSTKDLKQYNDSLLIAKGVLPRLNDVLTQLSLSKEPLQDMENAQQAVAKGFSIILPKLLKGDNKHAEQLGFRTDKDTSIEKILQNANLGDYAFPVFEVRRNDLRTFSPGTDAKLLLFYTNQLLWPIEAGDKRVQSSLTIRFISNDQGGTEQKAAGTTWRPTRWGQRNLINQLATEQEKLNKQKKEFKGFLVTIASLNLNFLGYMDNTAIKFVPLVTDRLFKKGESLSAEYVFEMLSDEAKRADDSPR